MRSINLRFTYLLTFTGYKVATTSPNVWSVGGAPDPPKPASATALKRRLKSFHVSTAFTKIHNKVLTFIVSQPINRKFN